VSAADSSDDARATRVFAAGMPRPLPEEFGRYRIVRALGLAGTAAVYLAHDRRLDRQVALKVPPIVGDAAAIERFRRAALAAAGLQHPNLCPVLDADEC